MENTFIIKIKLTSGESSIYAEFVYKKDDVLLLKNAIYDEKDTVILLSLSISTDYIKYIERCSKDDFERYTTILVSRPDKVKYTGGRCVCKDIETICKEETPCDNKVEISNDKILCDSTVEKVKTGNLNIENNCSEAKDVGIKKEEHTLSFEKEGSLLMDNQFKNFNVQSNIVLSEKSSVSTDISPDKKSISNTLNNEIRDTTETNKQITRSTDGDIKSRIVYKYKQKKYNSVSNFINVMKNSLSKDASISVWVETQDYRGPYKKIGRKYQ